MVGDGEEGQGAQPLRRTCSLLSESTHLNSPSGDPGIQTAVSSRAK
jgi:hypothetical protein